MISGALFSVAVKLHANGLACRILLSQQLNTLLFYPFYLTLCSFCAQNLMREIRQHREVVKFVVNFAPRQNL